MGVVQSLSLPHQHSLSHYLELIKQFGASNGLCSSITESKHVKAVKMPYQQSSHHQTLGQMLTINQQLNKLKAARVDFQVRSMLISCMGETPARLNILQVIGMYSFLSRLTNINSDLVEHNKTQHRLDKQCNALLMQEDPEAVASRHEDLQDSGPLDDQCVDVFVQLAKSCCKYLSQYCVPHNQYYV
jgi:hypothetical protein